MKLLLLLRALSFWPAVVGPIVCGDNGVGFMLGVIVIGIYQTAKKASP